MTPEEHECNKKAMKHCSSYPCMELTPPWVIFCRHCMKRLPASLRRVMESIHKEKIHYMDRDNAFWKEGDVADAKAFLETVKV